MEKLKDCVGDSEKLATCLMKNGVSHQSYNMYTSMERAMAFLLSGYVYLSDGSHWNDEHDRKMMSMRNAYATCFSYSTRENIAMWMLYSGNRGKSGAMLKFYPSVIKDLLNTSEIEIGKFNKRGQYDVSYTLKKSTDDFTIYMSDIVYTDECKNNRVKLTLAEDHEVVNKSILADKNIFHKNYAWAYERETRLIVRLEDQWRERALDEKMNIIRLRVSERSRLKMCEERLLRSPVYNGGTDFGTVSQLVNKVIWEL